MLPCLGNSGVPAPEKSSRLEDSKVSCRTLGQGRLCNCKFGPLARIQSCNMSRRSSRLGSQNSNNRVMIIWNFHRHKLQADLMPKQLHRRLWHTLSNRSNVRPARLFFYSFLRSFEVVVCWSTHMHSAHLGAFLFFPVQFRVTLACTAAAAPPLSL